MPILKKKKAKNWFVGKYISKISQSNNGHFGLFHLKNDDRIFRGYFGQEDGEGYFPDYGLGWGR